MFLLFNKEEEVAEAPTPEMMEPWLRFGEYAQTRASQESSAALQPSATATTVTVRNGKTVTTDGPFVDTKELVGGFYVFDCDNLDTAIDLAAHIPWAETGHVEVRPVMELP